MKVKEITVHDFEEIGIGQAEDRDAGTGCTVIVSRDGMRAGLDIRGGGPASRESQLLNPLMAAQEIHAVVLSGGSSFGLAAGDGVMRLLEERNIGFDVGVTKVPLTAQSSLFDLTVGDGAVRPDPGMGYEAARIALDEPNYRDGCYGAGCGATVGKIAGMENCMKSGIGSYAIQIGGLKIGAIAAVNALGDIFDWKTGRQIAGVLKEDRSGFRDIVQIMQQKIRAVDNRYTEFFEPSDGNPLTENTTLGVILTNAYFTKPQLCKIAGMAHDGYARCIRPVHTSADGDSIYAVSSGDVNADQDLAGALAADVMSEAILRAVRCARGSYGYPAVRDLGLET